MSARHHVPAILVVTLEGAFILSFRPLVDLFEQRFARFSIWNPVLVGVVYLLFCATVLLTRKLERRADAGVWSAKAGWLALPALCTGCLLLHVSAQSGGFYRWVQTAGSPLQSAWTPLVAMGSVCLSLVFLFVIVVDVRPAIGPGRTRVVVRMGCAVVAQLMIVVLAAWWRGLGSEAVPDPGIGTGSRILIFVAVYAFFLIFFSAPRLLLLAAEPDAVAALVFAGGMGYYVYSTL